MTKINKFLFLLFILVISLLINISLIVLMTFGLIEVIGIGSLLPLFLFDVESFNWLAGVIWGLILVYGIYDYIVMPDVLEKQADSPLIPPSELYSFYENFINIFPIDSFIAVLLLGGFFGIIKLHTKNY